MTGKRRIRPGSRLLLGIALLAGTFSAMYAGARLAGYLADLLGIASPAARIGAKVAVVVVALPAGFYLVERLFLGSARRNRPGPPEPGP